MTAENFMLILSIGGWMTVVKRLGRVAAVKTTRDAVGNALVRGWSKGRLDDGCVGGGSCDCVRIPVAQGRRPLYTVTDGKVGRRGGLSGFSGTEWAKQLFFYVVSRSPVFPRARACGPASGVNDAAYRRGAE